MNAATAPNKTAPKGKGMNGKTGWWVAGVLAALLVALAARQAEFGSLESDLRHHESVPAHGVVDSRIRVLEDKEIRVEEWRKQVTKQLQAIAKKVDAPVVLP